MRSLHVRKVDQKGVENERSKEKDIRSNKTGTMRQRRSNGIHHYRFHSSTERENNQTTIQICYCLHRSFFGLHIRAPARNHHVTRYHIRQEGLRSKMSIHEYHRTTLSLRQWTIRRQRIQTVCTREWPKNHLLWSECTLSKWES